MTINWKSETPARPVHIIPMLMTYALFIWLGTAVFYTAADGVQGAASGGTNGNIEQLR